MWKERCTSRTVEDLEDRVREQQRATVRCGCLLSATPKTLSELLTLMPWSGLVLVGEPRFEYAAENCYHPKWDLTFQDESQTAY